VPLTLADTSDLAAVSGFSPEWRIEAGMTRFVDWYRTYHQHSPPR
jgi:UDP-glucuronate 4-epimerase